MQSVSQVAHTGHGTYCLQGQLLLDPRLQRILHSDLATPGMAADIVFAHHGGLLQDQLHAVLQLAIRHVGRPDVDFIDNSPHTPHNLGNFGGPLPKEQAIGETRQFGDAFVASNFNELRVDSLFQLQQPLDSGRDIGIGQPLFRSQVGRLGFHGEEQISGKLTTHSIQSI